jgi:hypothetical protein
MQSTKRSTEYYRTEHGKMKKKEQNGKRSSSEDTPSEPEKPKLPEEPEAAEELEFDEVMVEHLRVQTSLLEEREVSREETIEMLRRVMRQHSMAPEMRRDYILRYLKEKEENPP